MNSSIDDKTVPEQDASGCKGNVLLLPDITPAHYALTLPLARSGPEPLYYQLAQSLEDAVRAGAICPGTKLPPDRDLAAELKISVGTVRNAWVFLERKGALTRRPRSGTIVQ